jgi:hypothetical protein
MWNQCPAWGSTAKLDGVVELPKPVITQGDVDEGPDDQASSGISTGAQLVARISSPSIKLFALRSTAHLPRKLMPPPNVSRPSSGKPSSAKL